MPENKQSNIVTRFADINAALININDLAVVHDESGDIKPFSLHNWQ